MTVQGADSGKGVEQTPFRVATKGNTTRDPRINVLLAEMVAIGLGIGLIAFSAFTHARWLFVVALAVVLCAIALGGYLGLRAGVGVLEQQLQFRLTDTELIAQRSAHPPVRVPLAEIAELRESRGWLTVTALRPLRKISIPDDVQGFANLRDRLASFCAPVAAPPPLGSVIEAAATVASAAAVIWAPGFLLIVLSSVIAIVLTGINTGRLRRHALQSSHRTAVLTIIAANGLGVAGLIWLRLLPAIQAHPNR